jgi:hypothetical protein
MTKLAQKAKKSYGLISTQAFAFNVHLVPLQRGGALHVESS